MPGFMVRMLITALGLWLAASIVPGMHVSGVGTLLVAAFLLGLVNATVRPVMVVLTFPITLLTLGLFLLVVNAAMLGLVAVVLKGFSLSGFFPALAGSLVVSFVSWIAARYVGSSGRYELMIVRPGR